MPVVQPMPPIRKKPTIHPAVATYPRSSTPKKNLGSTIRLEKVLRHPDVEQRLHRLDIFVGDEAVDPSDVDEVQEAGVERL
ncbi:hypothetical protein LTR28_010385, partial [Elasticomyces elasticus]